MNNTDYVTAGEFRDLGAVIDPEIPDHATVPRASIRMTPQGGASWERDGDTYRMPAVATFTEPFTWDDDPPPATP